MSEVKRYEADSQYVLESYDGDYVSSFDYDRLKAENKALREEIRELKDAYQGFRWAHDEAVQELGKLRFKVVIVPEKLQAEPFTTIDKGCKNYKAGWNACLNELARLNGKTVSEALLRKWLELMEHGDYREGHCMCGSAIDSHGICDGHAPVDAGEYYAGQVMEELRALLDAGKEDGNG